MKKRALRERIAELELELTAARLPQTSFDTLTVCFTDRTFTYKGRTVEVDANCFTIPLLSDKVPHWRTGWYPVQGVES